MDAARRKHVIPGDVITTGPYRPDQHTIMDGDRIIATAVGTSEIHEDAVKVIPLAGMYYPKVDDLVIGKVVSHSQMVWDLEINSCYLGSLFAIDVFGRDFDPGKDELSSRLVTGDLVVVRIANFDRTRNPLVTVKDRDLGKVESGDLVEISPSKIPRLVGKRGSMIQMIEMATSATITIGQNGWVIVSCDNSDGLIKAKKAIQTIEEQAHVANLTDRVKSMLESGGE